MALDNLRLRARVDDERQARIAAAVQSNAKAEELVQHERKDDRPYGQDCSREEETREDAHERGRSRLIGRQPLHRLDSQHRRRLALAVVGHEVDESIGTLADVPDAAFVLHQRFLVDHALTVQREP